MILAFDVEVNNLEKFKKKFFKKSLSNEILLRPIGNTIYWMPPYICNEEEINFLAEKTLSALENSL